MNSVEVLWLPRLVLLVPPVHSALQGHLASKLTVLLVAAHEFERLKITVVLKWTYLKTSNKGGNNDVLICPRYQQ